MIMSSVYQRFTAINAKDLQVYDGLCIGASLACSETPMLDDVFRLCVDTISSDLLRIGGRFCIAGNDEILVEEQQLTFMDQNGQTVLAVRLKGKTNSYLISSLPLKSNATYRLIDCVRGEDSRAIARFVAAPLAEGTSIAMAGGGALPVETLQKGDLIRTADGRECRIADVAFHRAHMAPLVFVAANAIGNKDAIYLDPSQQIRVSAPTAKLRTRVDALINGHAVRWAEEKAIACIKLIFDQPCRLLANGLDLDSDLHDLRPFTEEQDANLQNLRVFATSGPAYSRPAANDPSKISNSPSVVTAPNTTPATASAFGP